jgi:hypothetical protein
MKTLNFIYIILILSFFFFACENKIENVDTIFYHAKIYTVDSIFSIQEALAIKDGKVIAIGKNKEIKQKYKANQVIDASNRFIYAGLHDAHCHFFGLGENKQWADLVGAKSFEETVQKLQNFRKDNPTQSWLSGRGWDQNDWEIKDFPTKDMLDEFFPDVPVKLIRIDGHAMLVNQKALELAGINENTKVEGGEIRLKFGKPTGVLIDNAMNLIDKVVPEMEKEEIKKALLAAEKECFAHGLTTVTDAGLPYNIIQLIHELQMQNILKIRLNIMAVPNDFEYWKQQGKLSTPKLKVQGFKIYADGALGSRGACLLEPYSDVPETKGFLLSSPQALDELIGRIHKINFQINTHCIGDSSNRLILNLYGKYLQGKNDLRWRIEHAQVVNVNDFYLYNQYNIIPSVQPTHATSDMYWAEKRLGKNRIKGAYAFQQLLEQNQLIALGSDFPVEHVNPLYGFHAAITRQDAQNYPEGGFEIANALDRVQTLKGMTIWAAYASFWEKEIGSLEVGKYADFIILNEDIMTISPEKTRNVKIKETWVQGERVYVEN